MLNIVEYQYCRIYYFGHLVILFYWVSLVVHYKVVAASGFGILAIGCQFQEPTTWRESGDLLFLWRTWNCRLGSLDPGIGDTQLEFSQQNWSSIGVLVADLVYVGRVSGELEIWMFGRLNLKLLEHQWILWNSASGKYRTVVLVIPFSLALLVREVENQWRDSGEPVERF